MSLGTSPGFARTWHIRPDGSGDAPTIQAGIDSAKAGDDVLLAPGTYTWTSQGASGASMILMKRDVVLRSALGAGGTIADAESRGRVIACADVGDARIEALTITNGWVQSYIAQGAGVLSTGDSRLAISSCVVRGNEFDSWFGYGGGIYSTGGSITECDVSENRATAGQHGAGGGVYCENTEIRNSIFRANVAAGGSEGGATRGGISASASSIADCRIEDNLSIGGEYGGSAGGAAVSNCTMVRCLVIGNRRPGSRGSRGGGIACSGSTIRECIFAANYVSGHGISSYEIWGGAAASGISRFDAPNTITNCTFVGNIAEQNGSAGIAPVGGVVLEAAGEVRNCIFAGNTGAACWAPSAAFSCNDLSGNSGGDVFCGTDAGGNFNTDPQFCAADPVTSLNVLLQADSPCAPGNHPNGMACGLIGAGPVGCGTVTVEPRTWSAVKHLYR